MSQVVLVSLHIVFAMAEAALAAQLALANNISRFMVNFKKDRAEKSRTFSYVQSKIDLLERY